MIGRAPAKKNALAEGKKQPAAPAAATAISKENIMQHIKVLASDEYEGRAPATKGEELTIKYLETQFRKLGLKPGNPNRTYVQKVPMVGITADPRAQLVFTPAGAAKDGSMTLKYGEDFMAWTKRMVPQVRMDDDMIFVGYGVVAPEFQWDDYKGLDMKGKVLVMLINDPPVPDERVFGGKAMTYYGRWTYKYEIAAEKGAAGCLIIHETEPAGYPWDVVKGSWSGEQFDLVAADKNLSRCAVEGWITYEKAKALFAMTGKDLDALKKSAVERNFKPVALGAKAAVTIQNKLRMIDSHNVVAKLEGHDPKRRNEYVVYTAHWDHLGIGPEINGDKIYNGARDNASGTAGLLEIARAFSKVQPPPSRSILFLSVTAEEKGLIGSRYYSEHPLYPLEKTLAAINMDGLNVLGPTRDIIVVGLGNSTLDDYVKAIAAKEGRTVKPDAEPEKGYYYRSDHFNFAKQGVPALDPGSGTDFIGRPEGWGLQMRKKYTAEDYHKPSDQVKPDWDLSGAAQDLRLLFEVGYQVANADKYPSWNPGTEFKAKRDAMMNPAGHH
ncbi:MAG: M28 family peptidase [Acidobacteria bacterium]|nr:M28 family peptidase [Acidobacteriota bacterium]MBI3656479.1 M28 family peptidase [Acidobacteriota bacterium]